MSRKIWNVKDYPGLLIYDIVNNKDDLPDPLPWIEPSINNLYLEACSSFLFGNYFSTIVNASILLEHTLRLALVNKEKCGLNREESINKIDQFQSLKDVIDNAIGKDVFNSCNEQWWRDVAKYVRNKSAHYLLPKFLRKCMGLESFKDYFDSTVKKENNDEEYYNEILTDWGAFYHKDARRFSKYFLKDVHAQLSIIINNTNWTGDESWWISQKKYL